MNTTKKAVRIQSLQDLLDTALRAETAEEITITFDSGAFKELAISIYDGGYTEMDLFKLFKDAKIQITK
ncbi:hypothetical protein [Hydrogenimonas thermophila]|uniref:Uncharacterized protein n=1 Tax=Hydrogenimonas thermophila TaxID=223786 RepID=A0A1I5NPJ4_9BACT|nr:hypothetical protein [Hydrogenimonas thermophila]SFP23748.1 hypothetical protein SAMN05216234_11161 [Hydrogenimonas thermophila]